MIVNRFGENLHSKLLGCFVQLETENNNDIGIGQKKRRPKKQVIPTQIINNTDTADNRYSCTFEYRLKFELISLEIFNND